MSNDLVAGVILCLEKALAVSGIRPEEVTYVNAHATSTQAGDMASTPSHCLLFCHHDIKPTNCIAFQPLLALSWTSPFVINLFLMRRLSTEHSARYLAIKTCAWTPQSLWLGTCLGVPGQWRQLLQSRRLRQVSGWQTKYVLYALFDREKLQYILRFCNLNSASFVYLRHNWPNASWVVRWGVFHTCFLRPTTPNY